MSTPTSNNGKQTSIHRPKDAPFTIHNSILYDQKLRALRAEAEALRLQLGYVRPPSLLPDSWARFNRLPSTPSKLHSSPLWDII